jgi:hypothetical protein
MPEVFAQPLSVVTESSLSAGDAEYLGQVRAAAFRLGRRGSDDGVADAVADVEDAATIDVDIPTVSHRPAVRLIKRTVKSLVGWYLRYLAEQTTVLGQATARLGTALAERADRMEGTTTGLAAEVARLRARVDELEGREGSGRDRSGPGPR